MPWLVPIPGGSDLARPDPPARGRSGNHPAFRDQHFPQRQHPLSQPVRGRAHGPAPDRLLVLSDERIGTVPLSLFWPGSGRPPIETTTVGWIARFDQGAETDSQSTRIHAIIAPGNAATEKVGLLQAALCRAGSRFDCQNRTATQVDPHQRHPGHRAALLSALSDPDAWVHLAAHGYAKPELLGYAGTWLANPADPAKSDFRAGWTSSTRPCGHRWRCSTPVSWLLAPTPPVKAA